MKNLVNWHNLLNRARNAIAVAPIGSFVPLQLGGELRRKSSGWVIRYTYQDKTQRCTKHEAAISFAAASFAAIQRSRAVLPLP